MNPYRENQRLGALIGEHRAARLSWLGAALLGAVSSVGLGAYVAQKGNEASMQSVVGVVVMGMLALWAAREWLHLGGVVVRIYERGLWARCRGQERELLFDEVTAVEAQYVPGVRGKGSSERGNMVSVILSYPGGTISLPKELHDFTGIVATLEKRIKAQWRQATIANLTQRG